MTRVALILSGGASLGSYVGGAATEILRALMGNRSRERVTLDVVTGASAGALTAGLVARAVTVNVHLLPWIERAWVDGADAAALLNPDRSDRSGWFDASAVEQLADALIAADPASDDEPSETLGEPLRLALTLSNLRGVRYDFRYGFLNVPDRFYGTRLYADWIEFELRRENRAGDPVWEEIREAALASGSFPFAFPPRRLRRRIADYPGARLPEAAEDGTVEMWYADGGLFDNTPLGLAKRLVERSPDHREADWRYIMVEPSLRSASGEDDGGAGITGSPAQLAGLLASAVLGQGAAKDWIRANKVNVRLEILQAIVERIPEMNQRLGDPEAVVLGRRIGELAERVAEMKVTVRRAPTASGPGDPVLEYLDENQRRIEKDPRYASVLSREESRVGRARLAKFIFVLEAACGLRDKERMALYLVAPAESGQLSGDFMGNFGGFFNREWRANDFRAGRRDARRLIEQHLGDVIDYEPEAAAYEVVELEPSFDSIPPESRRQLEALIEREADRLLAEIRPGALASLFGWAWKPVIRGWAKDRIVAALREMA